MGCESQLTISHMARSIGVFDPLREEVEALGRRVLGKRSRVSQHASEDEHRLGAIVGVVEALLERREEHVGVFRFRGDDLEGRRGHVFEGPSGIGHGLHDELDPLALSHEGDDLETEGPLVLVVEPREELEEDGGRLLYEHIACARLLGRLHENKERVVRTLNARALTSDGRHGTAQRRDNGARIFGRSEPGALEVRPSLSGDFRILGKEALDDSLDAHSSSAAWAATHSSSNFART
jgi:hypothetical protein